MNGFEYDKTQSTTEMKNQRELSRLGSALDRKLTQKVFDFLDKV